MTFSILLAVNALILISICKKSFEIFDSLTTLNSKSKNLLICELHHRTIGEYDAAIKNIDQASFDLAKTHKEQSLSIQAATQEIKDGWQHKISTLSERPLENCQHLQTATKQQKNDRNTQPNFVMHYIFNEVF